MSCNNTADPLRLAITNVTVSNSGLAVARGVEVALGSPAQILSLRPSTGDRDLFIYNSDDCDGNTNGTCVAPKGGVFSSVDSTSYQRQTEAAWNGTDDPNLDNSYIYFTDTAVFGNSKPIFGFPALLNTPGHGSQGGLPLGPNSTFLRAAVESKSAPSLYYSIWVGSRSISNPMDGELVIGGYNVARTVNMMYSRRYVNEKSDNCHTCVNVTSLRYRDGNKALDLLAEYPTPLRVGLDPFENGMQLPQSVYDTFASASGGIYSEDYESLVWPSSSAPADTMTITAVLDDGFETTIPASEIFGHPRHYDADGVYTIRNNTLVTTSLSNGTRDGFVPSWGVPFLTMNVMNAWSWPDKHEVELASADRNATVDAEIMTMCNNGGPLSMNNEPETTGGNKRAVRIGAPVAAVVGFLIIVAVAWFFWRRRSRRRRTAAAGDETQQQQQQLPQYEGQQMAMAQPSPLSASGGNISDGQRYELVSPISEVDSHPRVSPFADGHRSELDSPPAYQAELPAAGR